MRLFHFSDDPAIRVFVPRPVTIPSTRGPGREWLNDPLIWAIDGWHQPMYFFPRDCPRILVWPVATTTAEDRERWFGGTAAPRMIAHVERTWWGRIRSERLHRYELPPAAFEALDDAGMYVSREPVEPLGVETLSDLPGALREAGVELRTLDSLTSLRDAWKSSLHVSGIRLRNAKGWAS